MKFHFGYSFTLRKGAIGGIVRACYLNIFVDLTQVTEMTLVIHIAVGIGEKKVNKQLFKY